MAKPPVRKLAKDGVDIAKVLATGTRGEVTRDDVVRQIEVKTVLNVRFSNGPANVRNIFPSRAFPGDCLCAWSSQSSAPHVSVC